MQDRLSGFCAACFMFLHLFNVSIQSQSVSSADICSGDSERHDKMGNISSPMYPSNYPNGASCKWHIYHEPNQVITISFYDMDIADKAGSSCTTDFLRITEKDHMDYCENQPPDPYISTTEIEKLTIVFQSGPQNTGRGFKFMYYIGLSESESCDSKTEFHCVNQKCIPIEWLCNGMDECGDRSDEDVHNCHGSVTEPPSCTTDPTCPVHTMPCCAKVEGNPICLPENKKCDGNEDCENAVDEIGCAVKCRHDFSQPSGSFSSPNYPNTYPDRLNCTWAIYVGEDAIAQLRFVSFELEQGYRTDYVTVYDGSSMTAPIIGTYYGYKSNNPSTSTHYPPPVVEGSGSWLYVNFVSDSNSGNSGFNATFQIKGNCIDDQKSCPDFNNIPDCYAPNQQCDQEFACLQGDDELGCPGCVHNEIICDIEATHIKCYPQSERCNGKAQCSGKEDEEGCSSHLCNATVGLFLCGTNRCIMETWWCDTNYDCEDSSDEMNCPLSTKVVTAAVVGSIVCGLLLVAALSCTCKLYQLYHSDPHLPTHRSPLSEIEDELMRREAPPSYTATMASPHFDDAQRAFIESLQAAAQARQEGRGRRLARMQTSQNGHAEPSSTTENAANSTQDANPPVHNANANANGDASQQVERRSGETTNVEDDSTSPYTEIRDVRQPNQAGDASSYTTDTDSDTNAAEAEIETRNRDIMRAATNIRRMRLAGGVQNIVDSVTNRQREREDQRNSTEDSRRRSSSGLQSLIERISRSRNRQDSRQEGAREEETSLNESASGESGDGAGASSNLDDRSSAETQNSLSLSLSSLQAKEEEDDEALIDPSSSPTSIRATCNSSEDDALIDPSSSPTASAAGTNSNLEAPNNPVLANRPSSPQNPISEEDKKDSSDSLGNTTPPSGPLVTSNNNDDDDSPLDLSISVNDNSTIVDDGDVPLVS